MALVGKNMAICQVTRHGVVTVSLRISQRESGLMCEFARVTTVSHAVESMMPTTRRQFFWIFGVVGWREHFLWDVVNQKRVCDMVRRSKMVS